MPEKSAARTREEIMRSLVLDRSEELFTARGYHATSMDDIAAGAGISKPTLYKYFRNKYEIFSVLFLRIQEEFVTITRRVLTQDKRRREILEDLVGSLFRISRERRRFFLAMIREHHLVVHHDFETQMETWLAYRRQVLDLLEAFFAGWLRSPGSGGWGAREVAGAVSSLLEGIFYELLFCETCDAAVHKRFISELLLHGVLAEEEA